MIFFLNHSADDDGIHLELPSRAEIERIVLRARKDVDADFTKLGTHIFINYFYFWSYYIFDIQIYRCTREKSITVQVRL